MICQFPFPPLCDDQGFMKYTFGNGLWTELCNKHFHMAVAGKMKLELNFDSVRDPE